MVSVWLTGNVGIMATRTPSPARATQSRPSARTAARSPGRPPARGGKRPANGKSRASTRHARRGKSSPLPVRAVRGAWMGAAHLVGGTARRVGPVGRVVQDVVEGTLGRVGLALPIVLVALGVRLLRHPQDAQAGGRLG